MAERALATAFVNIVPGTKAMEAYLKGQLPGEVSAAGDVAGAGMARNFSTGFGSKLKGYIAPIAASFAATMGAMAVGNFLKDSITSASDFAEQGTAVSTVFGKAAGDIQKFAASGAKSLGQSQVQVLEAAKQFGVYGKAAGLAGADNADFSKTMVGLATDLASFNNTSVDDAILALGSGLRGEAEPLRQYGVLLDDATLRSKALEMGLIKTTKDALTPQQKVLAAYGSIMDQTGTQQGDFERTSAGLANQQRILSAQMANVGITVGTALLPAVNAVVTFFNNNLVPAFDNVVAWFKTWGGAVAIGAGVLLAVFLPAIVTSTVASVTAWATQTAAAIASSAAQLVASYKTIGGWVAMGIQAGISAAVVVGGWVATAAGAVAQAGVMAVQVGRVVAGWVLMGVQSLINAAKMAASWIIAMGPIGWVIAAVVGLVAIIIANWDNISKFTAKAWSAIVKWVSDAAKWLVDMFMKWTIYGIVISHWSQIMDFFAQLPAKFLAFGKNIIDGLVNGIRNAVGTAIKVVKDIGNNIANTFKSILGIHSPSKVFHEFGTNIIDGLKEGLTGDQAGVTSTMKKVSDWVANALWSKDIYAKTAANANKLVQAYGKTLTAIATTHDQVVKDVAAAQDKLTELTRQRLDLIAGYAKKYGSAIAVEEKTTASDAIKQLQDRIAKNKELIAVMGSLKQLGLSGDLYQQILDSGNIEFAQSVLAGGSATVNELNALAAAANATAQQLGEDAGNMLYGKGIEVAQGVYDGLVAKEADMRALMSSIAAEFAAKISAVIGADTAQADQAAADKAAAAAKKAGKAAPKTTAKLTPAQAAAAAKKVAVPKVAAKPAHVKLARGGLVNRPTRALIGEAGPELVTPLKDFERLVQTATGGQQITYIAAPNQSLDAEQALRTAMVRMKALVN